MDDEEEDETFTEQTATAINEKLTKISIPQLSGHEQIQLADIIECVALVERHRRSMDENGARFMLFFRQHALRKGRATEMSLSWREINWAFHSNSQDILVDFVSRQNHGSMLWEHARESGIFMWLSDINAVVRFLLSSLGKDSCRLMANSAPNLRSWLGMNTQKARRRTLLIAVYSTWRCARKPSSKVCGGWLVGTENK